MVVSLLCLIDVKCKLVEKLNEFTTLISFTDSGVMKLNLICLNSVLLRLRYPNAYVWIRGTCPNIQLASKFGKNRFKIEKEKSKQICCF